MDSAIHSRNHYPVNNISMRKDNCAIQWIEIYPVDIFIYREGVENNNFDPTIAETKGKNW